MQPLLWLFICFVFSAPAQALDYQLESPLQGDEAQIHSDVNQWEMRLTQRERTQYLNIFEREKQRFWLGYILGVGTGFVSQGLLSVPLVLSFIPLSLSGLFGPGPVLYNVLTVGALYSISTALLQTFATQWLSNQSSYYQFKMLPAFIANLVGQGLTVGLLIGFSGTSLGILTDPAVAWQDAVGGNAEQVFGSVSILGSLIVVAIANATLAPLFGSWMMLKTATIRPGFRVVRPAPPKEISLAPQTSALPTASLITLNF
jgi:hypothetical protein